MKRKEENTQVDNNVNPPWGNAFWGLILSQLRTNAFLLGPLAQDELSNTKRITDQTLLTECEYMLCQLDDAIEFSRAPSLNKEEQRAVDITQIASDFSEAFSRRFGPALAGPISLLVDHKLPRLVTYPPRLMRLFDCVVRSAQHSNSKKRIELSLRESATSLSSTSDCKLVVNCKGLSFSNSAEEIDALLKEFEAGNYLKCIRDLGLELCAALHVSRQLGGEVSCIDDLRDGPAIEFRFMMEKLTGKMAARTLPASCYFYTKSEALRETFKNIGSFHGIEFIQCTSLATPPSNARIIVDAEDLNETVMGNLKLITNPAQTILVLRSNDLYQLRKLAGLGFKHFVGVPIISNKIIRSLCGLDVYEPPREASESKDSRKLRVLIVDDAPTARIVLRDYFESEGHGVIEASDGSEFVLRVQQGEVFDIVFCDYSMCHMDGATAVDMVRQHEKRTGVRTPIVMMTSYHAVDNDKSVGFDRTLAKPVDTDKVASLVNDLVFLKR